MAKDKKAKKADKPKKAAAAPPSPKGKGGTDIRTAAEQLVELAKSPAVRELAVAALGAAAAKIAESTEARRKARAQRTKPDGDSAGRARGEAIQLGEVIRAAALEGARQLIDEFERGRRGAKGGKAKARKKESGSSDPESGEAR